MSFIQFVFVPKTFVQQINLLETTIIEHGAKLIIVDSIAALARRDFDRSAIQQRQEQLSTFASKLKYLAENFKIPIIVTNQVTTRFFICVCILYMFLSFCSVSQVLA